MKMLLNKSLTVWIKDTFTWIPFGIGISFVISKNSSISDLIQLDATIIILCIIFIIVSLLHIWLSTLLKNKLRGGLYTAGIISFLLYFSMLQPFVESIIGSILQYRYITIIALICLIIFFIWIKYTKIISPINKYLTIYINLLLLKTLFIFGENVVNYSSNEEFIINDLKKKCKVFVEPDIITRSKMPDIYYIIVDSYTSSNSLKKYWGYDNIKFSEYLRKRGFYIAEESRSFARYTTYSMASTLNMCADERLLRSSWELPKRMIAVSSVVSFLQSKGYEFINDSKFIFTESKKNIVLRHDNSKLSNTIYWMVWDTFIYQVIAKVYFAVGKTDTEIIQNDIEEISRQSQAHPKFVYAHFPIPHFPYYLDKNGKSLNWLKQSGQNSKQGYLEQIQGTNIMLEKLIDSIVNNNASPPIIIIQGDHGFRFLSGNEKFKETFTIMNAYLFPDRNYKRLSLSISPYNTFRVIFNQCFGARLPLLSDSLQGIRYENSR